MVTNYTSVKFMTYFYVTFEKVNRQILQSDFKMTILMCFCGQGAKVEKPKNKSYTIKQHLEDMFVLL